MFRLEGVVPPLITPFDQAGELDPGSLEKLVDFLKDKVDGLFVCGSYGSGPMMSLAERKRVAEICLKGAGGRIPVIVQTGTTNTRDTVELTVHAKEIGCQAVAAVAPYYFHHGPDSVVEFFSAMLRAAEGLPVYLYHNPGFSGYAVPLEAIKRLKGMGLKGMKDATFDILLHATYQRELGGDGFEVVLGTEAMWLSAFCLGAEAFIPGLGNAFPEICAEMYSLSLENRMAEAREVQFKINRVREIMYLARSTQLAIYAMLEIRGLIRAFPRSPFIPASAEETDKIRRALAQLEMI